MGGFIFFLHHHFQANKRNKINVIYNTALPVLFGVKYYADALWPICKERNINVNLCRNLIEVRPKENVAVFQNLEKPEEIFEEQVTLNQYSYFKLYKYELSVFYASCRTAHECS